MKNKLRISPIRGFGRSLSIILSTLLLASASFASGNNIRTKIIVKSEAQENISYEKPCYLVYPQNESLEALLNSGASEKIKSALQDKGYHIVNSPAEATVIIKIDYALLEPFEAEVTLEGRGQFDYSNSASSRNYAATTANGRYQALSNPERSRGSHSVGFVLDPNGKPIDIGNQDSYEAKYVEGEKEITSLILHPIILEVRAWEISGDSGNPVEIWKTTSSLENIQVEPTEKLLDELATASLKHLGKSLKEPKVIKRKRTKKAS